MSSSQEAAAEGTAKEPPQGNHTEVDAQEQETTATAAATTTEEGWGWIVKETDPQAIEIECQGLLRYDILDELEQAGVFPQLLSNLRHCAAQQFLHFSTDEQLAAALQAIPAHFSPKRVHKMSFACKSCGRLFTDYAGRETHSKLVHSPAA
jgi:hypothetical protein